MFSIENIHASNITQTKQSTFNNIYEYRYAYIHVTIKKDAINLKGRKKEYVGVLGEGKKRGNNVIV